ncbi:antibiotic biosynthesis monooxygenase [Paenibacillus sp. YYML68]|uniref:antibiotic biosynthesis monooxygenase family protein n=1 Tax=Paenibacillus sp. YYML68 TaxID=2909250 RepID=UPI002492FAED|nr:antibiotic biosynthesis monooxygenase family protein [Paenibacillus sp. YYML68]
MLLEVMESAVLMIKPGMANAFESAFRQASALMTARRGYISHELHKCIETDHKYMLLVRWATLKDHMVGFRQSPEYEEWVIRLQPYLESDPQEEHYIRIKHESPDSTRS